MKQFRITILLTMLMSMFGAKAFAHDIAVANKDGKILYYKWINDHTELAICYQGSSYDDYDNEYSGDVVIPESVEYEGNTYSVTQIWPSAFRNCTGLTSAIIPNSVTSVGDFAFSECRSLTSVNIGNGVTSIGDGAFVECRSLHSVTIPNSVTSIGGSAFYKCSALTYVIIPNSVTSIGESAFSDCSGLSSVTIPNSVTSIENHAFYFCSGLTSVTIPNSVTSIGYETFYNTAWYNNQPDGLVYAGKVAYAYKGIMPANTIITLKEGTLGIADYAFSGCSGLTSVEIPNSVTSIGEYAFSSCYGLTFVTIGNNVTSIGKGAFNGCSGLTSVTIPNSVTSIGGHAFYNCSGLTSVTIPNSVTSIGSYAFENTAWYNNQPDGIVYIGKVVYKYKGEMPANTAITLEDGTLEIAGSAFGGCSGLSSVTIPNSVTSIGSSAFYGCNGLTSITIPSSVTSIESYTFSGCSGLTSITIPSSVTSIGSGAFYGCSGLTSITIPNSVTCIGESAFEECSGLTSVTIPNSVTSIGRYPFRGCSGLTSIVVEDGNTFYDSRNNCNAIIEKNSNTLIAGCNNTIIPNSVTSIGDGAFSSCNGLTSVTIPNSVTSIGDGAFSSCNGLTSVIIPNSVTSIGEDAFYYCSSLTSVTIPNSVTSIGRSAFSGCSGLTSVDIPNGVTSIGDCAFRDCSGLTSVTIPNSVTNIGYDGFSGCTALNEIICKADTPPTCGDVAFRDINKSVCKLYVPKGHLADYQTADQWKEFTNIEEEEISETTEDVIKITSAGQTTWCSAYDLDFTDIEGIKAYTAGGYDRVSGTIWLMRVKQVPANEGILIMGTPGDYKVPHKTTGTYYVNMMKGTLLPITIYETEGEYTNYYLSSGSNGVGFYKVNGTVELKANRAYLPLLKGTTQAGTRFIGLGFEDDGTTDLTPALSKGEGAGEWYTLQGQRVNKPGKGIYIRNGKKVVIK